MLEARVMIVRPLLRLASRAALVALTVASVAVGCSRQGEGERCDLAAAGHDDCDSGLVCTSCRVLQGHVVDRCCPPAGTSSSDPRCASAPESECLSRTGTGGSGGSAGSAGASSGGAGTGGTAGTAGASSGGSGGDEEPAGAGGA